MLKKNTELLILGIKDLSLDSLDFLKREGIDIDKDTFNVELWNFNSKVYEEIRNTEVAIFIHKANKQVIKTRW